MRRALIIVALVAAAAACAYAAPSSDRTSFYSWRSNGQIWHFGFFSESRLPRTEEQIRHPQEMVVGVPALKRRLLSFHRGQNLAWRDNPPEFSYPPKSLLEEIRSFATRRGLRVDLIPAIYDP
jgi:hypothetical protein